MSLKRLNWRLRQALQIGGWLALTRTCVWSGNDSGVASRVMQKRVTEKNVHSYLLRDLGYEGECFSRGYQMEMTR